MTEYVLAQKDEDFHAASCLFKEYADGLNIDLGFQHFTEELQKLHLMYANTEGGIILAKRHGVYFGCAAIRKIDSNVAELKRMFVQTAFQGEGVGKRLLMLSIELAKKRGYTFIRLDTLATMQSAINLYRLMGFYEIAPYYHNPHASAVFFEKKI